MNGNLKKINANDISKIASGQVIVDLRSVIKELVENSLDAHATNIDIRLVNYGADLIEVVDNGSGILESDLPGLALKYYTSKIHSFGDIRNIHSFGFRGEALSCICELSGEFDVVTRHASSDVGWFIRYNPDGSIATKHERACNQGTTISVKNLFDRLPVRRRAYLHASKTQLSAMITLVQSFAISSLGVRFSLTHRPTAKASMTTILSVPANYSIKQRLQSVFGSSVVSSLTEFGSSFFLPRLLPEEISLSESMINSSGSEEAKPTASQRESDRLQFKFSSTCEWNHILTIDSSNELHGYVTGFVSRVGSSSNSSDRGNHNLSPRGNVAKQLIFVNGRMVEYRKIQILNALMQVWRDYEPRTLPIMVINFILPGDYFDINLSTDKRQILFVREDLLITAFQEIFRSAVDASNSNLQISSISTVPSRDKAVSRTEKEQKKSSKSSSEKPLFAESKKSTSAVQSKESVNSTLPSFSSPPSSSQDLLFGKQKDVSQTKREQESKLRSPEAKRKRVEELSQQPESQLFPSSIPVVVDRCKKSKKRRDPQLSSSQTTLLHESSSMSTSKQSSSKAVSNSSVKEVDTEDGNLFHEEHIKDSTTKQPPVFSPPSSSLKSRQNPSMSLSHLSPSVAVSSSSSSKKQDAILTVVSSDFSEHSTISQTSILRQLDTLPAAAINSSSYWLTPFLQSEFTGEKDSSSPESAEHELTRILRKDSFNEMEIIGQFNNSFILCQLNKDLYILDQHACDEKSNYEHLMSEVAIHSQKLIKPIPLELSPDQEFTVIHNQEIFKRNGFEISVSESQELGRRLQLTALPASKKYTFSVGDFLELLGIVMETGGIAQRTPKLAKILATRACHQSVRAGDPLNYPKMVSIVRRLAELDRPWSCPHGRPTLRHLVSLYQ